MKVAVCYVYPLLNHAIYYPLAVRFAQGYRQFPSGYHHELHILCNGGQFHPSVLNCFSGINYQSHQYNNRGWDIGAYQWAAENIPCDMLVCFGAPVHLHRPYWLGRMANAFIENGPGLYGYYASMVPNWHVRTTGFWCPPVLLSSYPDEIKSSKPSRYGFEFGDNSFTRFVMQAGFECFMVTWNGVYPFGKWDFAPSIDDALFLDQHIHPQGMDRSR